MDESIIGIFLCFASGKVGVLFCGLNSSNFWIKNAIKVEGKMTIKT